MLSAACSTASTAGLVFLEGITTAYSCSQVSSNSPRQITCWFLATTSRTTVGTAKIPAPACPKLSTRALSPNSATMRGRAYPSLRSSTGVAVFVENEMNDESQLVSFDVDVWEMASCHAK